MDYVKRKLEKSIAYHLKREKCVLLLGPRQTGKTTLLTNLKTDLYISFAQIKARQRYERDPALLAGEIEALHGEKRKKLFVIIDEIQKIQELMDSIQDLIDRKIARFVLTGSSARKLFLGGTSQKVSL